ncbi:MAG: isoleucine--tRNA ligase, partial [Bacteroidales bacterium]|nr:isoleucine--tRNA ligase [Bacteroidales bacterium]
LLSKLYDKNLLYKGYTIQPFSPAAGTGLSSHELNQPGCYRDVKDTTCTAQFKIVRNEQSEFIFEGSNDEVHLMAWTTTPWTLPSNTALAVGQKINYKKVRSFNSYTGESVTVILAKDLLNNYFNPKHAELNMEDYKVGDKKIPFEVIAEYSGKDLEGITYEQLMPFIYPDGDAFRVIVGDFVTTEDGTGIVHIAPTFGADDDRVAKIAKIAPLILIDQEGKRQPMVDRTGKFYRIEDLDPDFVKEFVNVELYKEYAGRFVKNAYDTNLTEDDSTLDVDLAVMLKKENKAFKVEKHIHSYPHCWRTDKPILYYPLDSWFIRSTQMKDRMIELNKTINWKPAATGTGRFGNWLENLVDWNLSRSRYWGVPLPIWTTEDRNEQICVGSAELMKSEIEKSIAAGFMTENPMAEYQPGDMSKENYERFDLHRPYADNIILVSASGQKMFREPDLIDVWFDSGAMPYAQLHYPFENKEFFETNFPADFIAEGVDQTRGWFFTLHAIATMLFDSVAFKNVVSNGLVLDKSGSKMSKRLGNAVDPFETIAKYGPDATRWYMITNAQPWDNLKFDLSGIDEVRRKFFGTLYNTYSFFSLYANIDGFTFAEDEIPLNERPEIDRWILSELNTLIKLVDQSLGEYEPTRAGRAIADFVDEHLSNWYVRLCRRRFWKGELSLDKISAYQTLYTCLETLAVISSPFAPFFTDQLFRDLNEVSGKNKVDSVHLVDFPVANESCIDKDLEQRMELAQQLSSMVLSLRKRNNLRVRQPLNKVMVPVLDEKFELQLEAIKDLVLAEVNVKNMEFLKDTEGVLVKKIKPDFKKLGPRYGKMMKQISAALAKFDQNDIAKIEQENLYQLQIGDQLVELFREDVEIVTQDIPGWVVANQGLVTVALDVTLTDDLVEEGIARELVNRIQNIRKDKDFEVTDKIQINIEKNEQMESAVNNNFSYICSETLTDSLGFVEYLQGDNLIPIEITDEIKVNISIEKSTKKTS